MKTKLHLLLILALLSSSFILGQNPGDWKDTDAAMGRPGQDQPDGTHKYGLPRTDMSVSLGGVQLRAGLALGSWVAFKSTDHGHAMAMGDLVLMQEEVGPVMQELEAGGIEITALHNHLLGESPHVMYMHIQGMGPAASLAKAIHAAIQKTKTPDAGPPAQAKDPGIDTKQIDQILGRAGKNNGGIYQISVPRAEHITDGGITLPNSMGVSTALNFQATGDGKAAITGDFVLLGSEVNSVIKALNSNGIAVTAVHNHMLTEQPRLFFMHFWANDDAVKLAKGLRAALDQTNSAK